MDDAARRLVAEATGAFALTFLGAGAIIATHGSDLVAIGLAHGLAIALMVCAVGHISGGHFNPAVSFAMLVTRRLSAIEFVAYVAAQFVGALIAAAILRGVYNEGAVASATPSLGVGVSVGTGLLVEAVLTFLLVFVIFGVAVDAKGSFAAVAGLPIGLMITADIYAGGNLTGAAMNPSRFIGTAAFGNHWANGVLYFVGPLIGAAFAGFLYQHVLKPAAA
jgi:MIP family channel proteins